MPPAPLWKLKVIKTLLFNCQQKRLKQHVSEQKKVSCGIKNFRNFGWIIERRSGKNTPILSILKEVNWFPVGFSTFINGSLFLLLFKTQCKNCLPFPFFFLDFEFFFSGFEWIWSQLRIFAWFWFLKQTRESFFFTFSFRPLCYDF